jgi:putative ABC transport system permease protein
MSVGAGETTPFDGRGPQEAIGSGQQQAGVIQVLPGYFETLGIRLRSGRLPHADEARGGEDVAIVSESAARLLFPGRQALGRVMSRTKGGSARVVGIVDDVTSFEPPSRPLVYIVPRQLTRTVQLVARTRTQSAHVMRDLRREFGALAPKHPVTAIWITDAIGALSTFRDPRFRTLVLGTFASLALGLAALGIFAVVAASVTARTREMGVRLAIGAQPRALVHLVVRQAVVPVVAGALAGTIAVRLLGRIAQAQIAGVSSQGAATLAVAVVTVGLAGLLAAYVPARRASRVDPVVALRAE